MLEVWARNEVTEGSEIPALLTMLKHDIDPIIERLAGEFARARAHNIVVNSAP